MLPTPGPLELVIILVIALLILGPGRLPDVGSALGKSIREFRKASTDLGDSMKVDTSPLPPETPDAPTARGTRTRRGPAGGGPARRAGGSDLPVDRSFAPQRADARHQLGARSLALDGRRRRPARRNEARRPGDARTHPATARDGAGRLRHVARRPSRRATDAPLPRDPRGRDRRRDRLHAGRRRSGTLLLDLLPDGTRADPRTGRRLRHPAADLAHHRDHPGDAGDPLPGLGVRRPGPHPGGAQDRPAMDPAGPALLRPGRRDRVPGPAVRAVVPVQLQ